VGNASSAVCTLGGESMGQRYEDLDSDGLRRFYLQYVFPPYSVGEVGRMGSPGRREIGHGKLAERALTATIPSKESFPYTIVSNQISQNQMVPLQWRQFVDVALPSWKLVSLLKDLFWNCNGSYFREESFCNPL